MSTPHRPSTGPYVVSLTPLLLAGLLLAPGLASAQTPRTFTACYVPDVGAVYMIGETGLPSACFSDNHVQFSWVDGAGIAETQAQLDDLISTLSTAGSLNDSGNPVAWTRLKDVPAGFADGTDDGFSRTTTVSVAAELPDYSSVSIRATCPAGAVVVGGGGSTDRGSQATLVASYPSSETEWRVQFRNETTRGVATAYAVCVY
jgi:hypothetical protein